MFVKAIETATKYTRPLLTISRLYGSTCVEPGCATAIAVNDEGWILTCKHVAQQIIAADQVNQKYAQFKSEIASIPSSDKHYKTKVRAIEKKYGYVKGKGILAQLKVQFHDLVDKFTGFQVVMHPNYDLALIRLDGFSSLTCKSFPVFAKDSMGLKQGKSLCRLGYPYPEFSNFKYEASNDDIVWTSLGRANTPLFPMDGILTRQLVDNGNHVVGVELSTPGLKGQSGGPLFDVDGVVYGLQSATHTLPLGFDQENREIKVNGIAKKVNDYSFIHLGQCVHVDIIKEFLDANQVKYQIG